MNSWLNIQKPTRRSLLALTLQSLLITVACGLYLFPLWIKFLFGLDVSSDSVNFYFSLGFEGIIYTDSFVLLSVWRKVLSPALAVGIVYVLLMSFSSRLRRYNHPLFSIIIFISSLVYFGYQLGIFERNGQIYGKDVFTKNYTQPQLAAIKAPQKKKNLLLIYIESLERTYVDSRRFGENLIKPLQELPGQGVGFYKQLFGTRWTIAGMVASQCSIPLKNYYKKTLQWLGTPRFLPGATCIGDILHQNGYTQYFLMAANARFAQTGNFYISHHYDHVISGRDWRHPQYRIPANHFTGWGNGLNDSSLFVQTEKLIDRLQKKKKPWNIAILTSDTHQPDGKPSVSCTPQEQKDGIKGSLRCTSRDLNKLITRLQKKGVLDNTVVIIMGDHLFMASRQIQSDMFRGQRRDIFFKLIAPGNRRFTRNIVNHFDIPPTILDALGFKYPNNPRYGLGISLYAPYTMQQYNKHYSTILGEDLLNHSDIYDSFWNTTPERLAEIRSKAIY